MELWMIILAIFGVLAVVLLASIVLVFLEIAFNSWPSNEDDYDDVDLDEVFRKKNYGD